MKAQELLGLDIGTSAVKGVALSENGKVLSKASGTFEYKKDGNSCLIEPEKFLEVCLKVIKTLSQEVGDGYQIVAVCPCCASGNLLFLDDNMKPMTDIIGWQTSIEADELAKYYSEEEVEKVYETVGWPVIDSFPISFFPWIKHNRPDMLSRAAGLSRRRMFMLRSISSKSITPACLHLAAYRS